MNKIKELIKNTQLNEDELGELIKSLEEKKQNIVTDKIIKYIESNYPKYKKYLEMIINIEIQNDVANYHQELYINIYTNNLIISKSYIGTTDGEDQENIYKITSVSDSKELFKFESDIDYYYDSSLIDEIDENALIESIVDTKKITKLAKLFKEKTSDFLKNIISLLDILNCNEKIHQIYND